MSRRHGRRSGLGRRRPRRARARRPARRCTQAQCRFCLDPRCRRSPPALARPDAMLRGARRGRLRDLWAAGSLASEPIGRPKGTQRLAARRAGKARTREVCRRAAACGVLAHVRADRRASAAREASPVPTAAPRSTTYGGSISAVPRVAGLANGFVDGPLRVPLVGRVLELPRSPEESVASVVMCCRMWLCSKGSSCCPWRWPTACGYVSVGAARALLLYCCTGIRARIPLGTRWRRDLLRLVTPWSARTCVVTGSPRSRRPPLTTPRIRSAPWPRTWPR